MKFFSKFQINPNKLIIMLVIFLSVTFNGYKNLSRIDDNNFENNPLKIIEPIKYEQKKRKLGEFTYYTGWFGNYPAGNSVLDNSSYVHQKKLFFDIIYKIK